jgi:hypothetical protein
MKLPSLVNKQNMYFFVAIFILVMIVNGFAGSIYSMVNTVEPFNLRAIGKQFKRAGARQFTYP